MAPRDQVSMQMRQRLLTNRHGKLTTSQWKDMVTEPLGVLLLLLAPAIIILGPRLLHFATRFLVVGLVVLVLVVVIPMLFRARRYARAPVYFERLYGGDRPAARLLFWRPQVLYTGKGKAIAFKKRLAPSTRLRANHAYIVYYLREADHHVLLSLAPADHPDAEKWQPSASFHARQAKRG